MFITGNHILVLKSITRGLVLLKGYENLKEFGQLSRFLLVQTFFCVYMEYVLLRFSLNLGNFTSN